MKSNTDIYTDIKNLLEQYPQLRDKRVNEILIAKLINSNDYTPEEISIFSKVIMELPSLSSIVRLLTKVRKDYPMLDTRKEKEVNKAKESIEDFINRNS